MSPRSGVCSSLQASACFQGAAELDLHGYTRKVIPAQIFKQSSHNGLKTSGLALDFSTVPLNKLLALAAKSQTSLDFAHLRVTFRPWRGITFAMEFFANFTYNQINTGTVKGHSLKPVDFWIK